MVICTAVDSVCFEMFLKDAALQDANSDSLLLTTVLTPYSYSFILDTHSL